MPHLRVIVAAGKRTTGTELASNAGLCRIKARQGRMRAVLVPNHAKREPALAALAAIASIAALQDEFLADQGWRTILPGMPPAAFALYASAASARGYTAPTWGRR